MEKNVADFPDVNNIELSFDYLTLDKRFDFEDENTQKFKFRTI